MAGDLTKFLLYLMKHFYSFPNLHPPNPNRLATVSDRLFLCGLGVDGGDEMWGQGYHQAWRAPLHKLLACVHGCVSGSVASTSSIAACMALRSPTSWLDTLTFRMYFWGKVCDCHGPLPDTSTPHKKRFREKGGEDQWVH